MCESVIHERLLSHCIDNDIITERQAAYLKGDSTISQLLYLVHQIRTSWDKSKIAHGLFLDISAAFDKVWHKGLLAKLEQIGISDTVLTGSMNLLLCNSIPWLGLRNMRFGWLP